MKRVFLSVAFIIVALTASLCLKVIREIKLKINIGYEMKILPRFTFYNLDGSAFSNDSISKSERVIFIHFNTCCDYCIYELEQIIQYADDFKQVKVLLISEEDADQIRTLQSKFHLKNFTFIKFLHDRNMSYYSYFGTAIIPSVVIYNSNGELIKQFQGETKIETILKCLNNSNE